MREIINSFTGRYYFLSNFYKDADGYCVEIEFQAGKATCMEDRDKILALTDPREAKKEGRKIELRRDWDQVKLSLMRILLVKKFSSTVMKHLLLSTSSSQLIEGNWWHDVFWGVCDGSGRTKKCLSITTADSSTAIKAGHVPYGENHLGILLMEVRKGL